MAIVENPIIGRSRRSFANVTFRNVNRNNIATSKIQKRYKDSSAKQSNCNSTWSKLHSIFHDIIPFISKSFTIRKKNQNSFNAFYQYIYPCFQYIDGAIFPLDVTKIKISTGFFLKLKTLNLYFTNYYTCQLDFVFDNFFLDKLGLMLCSVFVFDVNRLIFYSAYTDNNSFESGSFKFIFGAVPQFSSLEIFVCFHDINLIKFSETIYCGQVVQPYAIPTNQII